MCKYQNYILRCLTSSSWICLAGWIFSIILSSPLFAWYKVNHRTGEIDSNLNEFFMVDEFDRGLSWEMMKKLKT